VRPVLIIHGGAGRDRPAQTRQHIAVQLRIIAQASWAALRDGAPALDVVVDATERLESDPLFNAGTGSKLQRDGVARLSASLMDGAQERFSGVINVPNLAHPITLCRALLEEEDRVLDGPGALSRARELGLEEKDLRTPESIARWQEGVAGQTGTVGAVALDLTGRVAAATSTGGRGMERVGRVSDSCTVAGNYATAAAAVSCTGIGEHIVDGALAVRLVGAIEGGATLEAAAHALRARMSAHAWSAGLIALDHTGAWATPHTTDRLYWHAVVDGAQHSFQSGED
jgi:L-asparaginase